MINRLLNLPRLHKQLIAIALDALCLPLVFLTALALRFENINADLIQHYFILIIAAPLLAIPIFIRLGLYRAVIRFIDQKVVSLIFIGVTLSVIALVFLSFMLQMSVISRAVFTIYWSGSILYVGGSRLLARAYLGGTIGFKKTLHQSTTPIAIYGAGKSGVQLARVLLTGSDYECMFFIDDNPTLHKTYVASLPVIAPHEIAAYLHKFAIKEIFLAIPSASKQRHKEILNLLEPFKIHIKVTPSIKSLLNGELRLQDIRDVEIEDLLGRDSVAPNPYLLSAISQNKNVIVTGAGGSIGSELCRQILKQQPSALVLFDVSEAALYTIEQELKDIKNQHAYNCPIYPILGSVQDSHKIKTILSHFKIQTVFHAAAYKHVPLVEHNPIEGIYNNIFGTLHTAQAAHDCGVEQFVLISTDKAVRPTNVMGSTKRCAELVLQAFAQRPSQTNFCMVRFGNVLGSSGSVVPLFKKQIAQGGPITLTHKEMTRYFMTIPEAAQLVLQAGAMAQASQTSGQVFVLDMGEPVKIRDLAYRMVHLSGLEIQSEIHPEGSIRIEEIGLRPGEKLYEELLIGENVEATEHPLIMRATEKSLTWPTLHKNLQQLEEACQQLNHTEIRRTLLSMVEEYQPQCDIEDFLYTSHSL